ncbi:MAG: hypothetical protein ACXADY_01980 [Candidatus Hodarchaeales archaeon]
MVVITAISGISFLIGIITILITVGDNSQYLIFSYNEFFLDSKSVEILFEEGHIYDIEYRTSVYSESITTNINATFLITAGEEVIYSGTFFDEGEWSTSGDEDFGYETSCTAFVSHTYVSRNITKTMNYTISIIINSYIGDQPRSSVKIYKDLVWSLGFPSWPWIMLIITGIFFLIFFICLPTTLLFFFIWVIYTSTKRENYLRDF